MRLPQVKSDLVVLGSPRGADRNLHPPLEGEGEKEVGPA